MLLFRHQRFRKFQDKLISDVITALEEGKTLLAHAPMGLGKTDAVLSPALTKAIENGLSVFFLTPKISQHEIAVEVVRGINEKYGTGIRVTDMVGRRYCCIYPSLHRLDQDNFYSACEKLRKEELCSYHRKAVGYSRDESIEAEALIKKFKLSKAEADHKSVLDFGEKHEACPYEISIKLARDSTLIIADYFHFFIPSVRESFLKKIKKDVKDCIIIVDEAHNLPSRIREQLSRTITENMLKKVDKEAEELGLPKLGLYKALREVAKGRLNNHNEVRLDKDSFIKEVEKIDFIDELSQYLDKLGTEYTKATNRSSSSVKVARFLEMWQEERLDIVRILRKTTRGISLSRKSLDPSISTSIINQADSAVIMSGTLMPLVMYKDVLGVESPYMRAYESPFKKENRLTLIVKGVTTRYSKRGSDMYERYARKLDQLYSVTPGGMAVFFPSFEVMEEVRERMNSYPILMQKRNSLPYENKNLLEVFSAHKKALLFGVQGGSLSEGVDFSEGEIKTLVVLGLALEDMKLETKALIDYYQDKFKKGWEYAYIYPAITKALQASGRAIRKESHKAAIIFMDERFAWNNYFPLLPEDEYIITSNPAPYVAKFFNGTKDNTSMA